MSYNLIAITEQEPDWNELHSAILNPESAVELFPIIENDGKHYLGLSIPSSKLNANPNTWQELMDILKTLHNYHFKVFDLYNGFYIDDSNLAQVKSSLVG